MKATKGFETVWNWKYTNFATPSAPQVDVSHIARGAM